MRPSLRRGCSDEMWCVFVMVYRYIFSLASIRMSIKVLYVVTTIVPLVIADSIGPYGIDRSDADVSLYTHCPAGHFVHHIKGYTDSNFVKSLLVECSEDGVYYDGIYAKLQSSSGSNLFETTCTAGFRGVDVTWPGDTSALCSMTVYSGIDGSVGAHGGRNCGSTNFKPLRCSTGQKMTGVILIGRDRDAVFKLGIYCDAIRCTGSEQSPDFCSCAANEYKARTASGYVCTACSVCSNGQYLSSSCSDTAAGVCSACTNAGANQYYTGSGGSTNNCPVSPCTSCSPGQLNSGCGNTNPGSCVACASPATQGRFFSTGCTTDICSPNTYSSGGYVSSCSVCPSNSNSASGSSTCECNAGYYGTMSCVLCPAGYACLDGVKTTCNPGTYSSDGLAGCTSCSAGTYAAASASTACAACNAGSVSIAAASVCTPCDPGNFAASPGQASPCSACLPGTYASGSGLATCSPCAVGKYSGASYSVTCTECAKGTYATGTGFDNPNTCIACNPGSFGATTAASTCQLCTPGKYSDSDSSQVCSSCLSGLTYSSTSGAVICTQCSAPTCSAGNGLVTCTTTTDARCVACTVIPLCTYTTGGTCTDSNGVALCNCVSGYQLSSGACSLCPAGKFKPLANSAACAVWTVTACNPGFYLSNGNAFHDSECVACPPLPANTAFDTAAGGCSWRCLAGFNNSVAGLV